MYERMKKGYEWLNFNNNYAKIGLILFVILSIISAIFYFKVGLWPKAFHYPSEEIQILTKEGYRIIEENDFNSEYQISTTITTHTDKTKTLQLTVDGPNSEVTIKVENWESNDQKIIGVSKAPSNKVGYCIAVLLFSLLPALLGSVIITFVGIVIFEIILGISYLHHKVKKSKKE